MSFAQPPIPACPLCRARVCDCNRERGPFDLIDAHNKGCGSFGTIAEAVQFNAHPDYAPYRLIDRHKQPVKLSPVPDCVEART